MKRAYGLVAVGFIVLCVLITQGCVVRETTQPPSEPFHHRHLRVSELTMYPDPAVQGQRLLFSLVMMNDSSFSTRVSIALRDGDEIVSEVFDISIRPGINRIRFPYSGYRFSREDHCFVVLVDIEGNRRPVDLARRFCAQRTYRGWTLSGY